MRTMIVVILTVTAAISMRVQAQNYNGDYNRLREQQQKAIQAAVEPINRRYVEALEQLLRKATQVGDLNTAIKIKEELGRYASVTSSTAPAAVSPAPNSSEAPISPLLVGKWKSHTEDGVDDVLDFRADGTVLQTLHRKQGKWSTQGDVLIINIGNQSQRYKLPLDPITNKGTTEAGRAVRITKTE